ncbi:MAG TPA: retropepsin-like aspartic protease [Anaeromyxobacteraceae bacterium]|nr:retropepsin-like aspartic protease [Anaeromyxobacteraceae bacterium]
MRRPRNALPAALAVLLVACAHGPPPARRAASLEVHASPGGIRPFVRATVAGKPMLLLLDTGATRSVLPTALARELGLRIWSSDSDDQIIDANGRTTRLGTVKAVPVQFEGEAVATRMDFLANGERQAFPVLAPQDLVAPGWAAVIDLERKELRYEPEAEALARTGRDGSPLRETAFRTCSAEGFFNRFHRIVTAVVGGVPSELVVDTGASRTALTRNNPALPALARMKGSLGATASHASTGQALFVQGVPIEFAGTTFTEQLLVVPTSSPCWEGALGADLLRHCTLVWAWSSLRVACHAPGHPD